MRPDRIVNQSNQRRVGLRSMTKPIAPPFFIVFGFFCIGFILITLFGGCSYLPGTGAKEQEPTLEQIISVPYEKTTIKESLMLDVLPGLQRSSEEFGPRFKGSELFSRSETVLAAIGQTEDGRRNWFNMVAFDGYGQNAVRKYLFFVDDRNAKLIGKSRRGLRFDCRIVMPEQVLNGTYESESAKRVALLRNVMGNLRGDINELVANVEAPGQSNKLLDISGMLMNQVFEAIFLRFDSAPVLATTLGRAGGVEFDHITFNKGKVRMVVEGDIVTVQIRLGNFIEDMAVPKETSQ